MDGRIRASSCDINVSLRRCTQVRVADKNASIIYRHSDIIQHTEAPRRSHMCLNRSVPLVGPPVPDPDVPTPRHGLDIDHGAVCELTVVVDHTFYREIARGSRDVAVSAVVHHVAVADFVFRTTDMVKLDALPDNIGFSIGNIKIYESPYSDDYPLWDVSLNGDDLINQFSTYNWDGYCLAVAFTYREFGQILPSYCLLYRNINRWRKSLFHKCLFLGWYA